MRYPTEGYRNERARNFRPPTGFQGPADFDFRDLLRKQPKPRVGTVIPAVPGRSPVPAISPSRLLPFIGRRFVPPPFWVLEPFIPALHEFALELWGKTPDQNCPTGVNVSGSCDPSEYTGMRGNWNYCAGPHNCSPAGYGVTHQRYFLLEHCPTLLCNQSTSGVSAYGTAVPWDARALTLGTIRSGTYDILYSYRRPAQDPADPNATYPPQRYIPGKLIPLPKHGTAADAIMDPLTQIPILPAGETAPVAPPYAELPHRPTHPVRSPDEQTQRGNEEPWLQPPPPPARPSEPAVQQPPGPGTYERKLKVMPGTPPVVRAVIEAAFEAIERVDCLDQALPRHLQAPPGATAVEKAGNAYMHADKMSMCKLIECAVNEQIEDRLFGLLGKLSKLEAQATGRAHGLGGLSKKLSRHSKSPGPPTIRFC